MNECVLDHKARGRHSDNCDDNTCRGCRPAQTSDGTLYCRWHLNTTHEAITGIPDLITHIRTLIAPGAAPLDPGPAIGKREPPAPLVVTAVSDADDLHAALAELAELVMTGRGLEGPNWAGSDIRPAAKRHTAWGAIKYEPARIAGVKDPAAAAAVAAWLIPHEPWLTSHEDATGAIDALLRLYSRTRRAWPTEETSQHLPTPCPACDRLTLTRHAPRWAGAPVTITCTHPDCSSTIPEHQYGLYTRIVLTERRGA